MELKFSFACVIYYTFKCFCTCVGLWEYNSTCFLKGLVTCVLLFICMVDQTQMYPSSILPSGLFQGIICNSEWEAEMGTFEAWITGGPKLEGGLDLKGRGGGISDPSSYHAPHFTNASFFIGNIWTPFLGRIKKTFPLPWTSGNNRL